MQYPLSPTLFHYIKVIINLLISLKPFSFDVPNLFGIIKWEILEPLDLYFPESIPVFIYSYRYLSTANAGVTNGTAIFTIIIRNFRERIK